MVNVVNMAGLVVVANVTKLMGLMVVVSEVKHTVSMVGSVR